MLKDIRRVAFMDSCFGNYQRYGTLLNSYIMLYFLFRNTWCPLLMIGGRHFNDLFLNHIGGLNFTGGLDVLVRLILNQKTS